MYKLHHLNHQKDVSVANNRITMWQPSRGRIQKIIIIIHWDYNLQEKIIQVTSFPIEHKIILDSY